MGGGGEGILIRDGVARLMDRQIPNRPFGIAVLGDDNSAVNAGAEIFRGGLCHGPCGLAHRHQNQATGIKAAVFQNAADCFVGLNLRNCTSDNGIGMGSQQFIHKSSLFLFLNFMKAWQS
ncbi:hypothetical protein DSECCO2_289310 [anaerobic digester metagenome]